MLQTLLLVFLFITTPTGALPVTFSYYQAVPAQTFIGICDTSILVAL